MVLTTLLSQFEIANAAVDGGQAAIGAWETGGWDVILMDIHMPGMDGLTASKQIRAREQATGQARTPIIAVTASVLSHETEAYFAAGMDDFVAKPIEIGALIENVIVKRADGRRLSPRRRIRAAAAQGHNSRSGSGESCAPPRLTLPAPPRPRSRQLAGEAGASPPAPKAQPPRKRSGKRTARATGRWKAVASFDLRRLAEGARGAGSLARSSKSAQASTAGRGDQNGWRRYPFACRSRPVSETLAANTLYDAHVNKLAAGWCRSPAMSCRCSTATG